MPHDTGTKGRRRAFLSLLAPALALLLCPGVGDAQRSEEPPPNSIQVTVDGALKKTWSADQLMRGRFDWTSAKGKFQPAVALAYALAFKDAGFTEDSIAGLEVIGKKNRLRLAGGALAYLKELLLVVDIDKGGTWKLAARTREAENALKPLVKAPEISLESVRRIDVITGVRSTPKR